MPRRPRVRLDGIPLHIVQRGHNREPCFFKNAATVPKLVISLGRRYVQYIKGAVDNARRVAYRSLFWSHLDPETISDLRLALDQSQPLGNERFYDRHCRGRKKKPRQREHRDGSQKAAHGLFSSSDFGGFGGAGMDTTNPPVAMAS
jgi:hypothetical protein